MREAQRLIGFVLVNVLLTAGYVFAVCQAIPPLRGAEATFVLVPLTLLAIPISVFLHRIVVRLHSTTHRALAYWGAFVALLLAYGAWMALSEVRRGHETPVASLRFLLVAFIFGHWFGAPGFLALGGVNKLLSRWLTPRVATA